MIKQFFHPIYQQPIKLLLRKILKHIQSSIYTKIVHIEQTLLTRINSLAL